MKRVVVLQKYLIIYIFTFVCKVNANDCVNCYSSEILPKIGSWNTKKINHIATKTCGGTQQLCYKVRYKTNKYGARIGVKSSNAHNDKHLFIFGGSYVYGEGLNYEQTTSYFLQKKLNRNILNYSLSGSGPVKMLSHLRFGLSEIQSKGDALFFVKSFHLNRIDLNSKAFWLKNEPFYFIKKNNKLEYIESRYENSNFFQKFLYHLFMFSQKIGLTGYESTYFSMSENMRIETTKAIFKEAQDIYSARFGGKLYIVMYSDDIYHTKLISHLLEDNNLNKVILARKKYPKSANIGYLCACDNHPDENYHRALVKQLLPHLNQLDIN